MHFAVRSVSSLVSSIQAKQDSDSEVCKKANLDCHIILDVNIGDISRRNMEFRAISYSF